MSFEFKQFKQFVKDFEKINKNYDKFVEGFLLKMALNVKRNSINRTPVDTGFLRRSWEIGSITRQGDYLHVEIKNTSEYASFVEEGHWQDKRWVPGDWVGGKFEYEPESNYGMMLEQKYIPGKHMARLSISEVEKAIPGKFNDAFSKYIKKLGG